MTHTYKLPELNEPLFAFNAAQSALGELFGNSNMMREIFGPKTVLRRYQSGRTTTDERIENWPASMHLGAYIHAKTEHVLARKPGVYATAEHLDLTERNLTESRDWLRAEIGKTIDLTAADHPNIAANVAVSVRETQITVREARLNAAVESSIDATIAQQQAREAGATQTAATAVGSQKAPTGYGR